MIPILVVEDHAIVREPLARLLRLEGYAVLCAAHGIDALAALEKGKVELVLLDLMMPKKDGVTFLEVLRHDPRWRELPVIVMTGLIEGSQLDRVRELGVSGVLAKARFNIEELFDHMRRCLAKDDSGVRLRESARVI